MATQSIGVKEFEKEMRKPLKFDGLGNIPQMCVCGDKVYINTELDRDFEKITFEQYAKTRKQEEEKSALEYVGIKLPQRQSARSAGYDISTPYSVLVERGSTALISTGIKASMPSNNVLKVYIRSSLAIKKGLMLANNIGIVDSDYYNNEDTEGNIFIKLINLGDADVVIDAGERIAQGIFETYYTTVNDKPVNEERVGGIGSTGN